jgi:hypothetical protein
MRLALAIVAALILLAGQRVALAQGVVRTCVHVTATRDDAQQIERLVKSEVARHPTHVVVDEDCRTTLEVELIEVHEGRYVTGRIGSQVPHRVRVTTDLLPALQELLTVVLHNDPLTLEGPRNESRLSATLDQLRRKGNNLYGMEVFEWLAVANGHLLQMPGVAVRVRREFGALQIGGRIAGAWAIDRSAATLHPVGYFAGHAELAAFSSARADTAVYASGLIGVEHQRFEGPAPSLGPNVVDGAHATLLSLGLRVGVELMRTTDARLDVFAQPTFPIWKTHDIDGEVIDAWVPSLTLGAGLAF